ncbi:MAG: hypothetical protein FJ320_12300 [SAR202 cluster bacterium]|nr:hypothetical protein [SAR202 cluster bacterium]
MPNVRIDANGAPKAAVFEHTAPAAHRSGVTAVDASDPADASGAIDCGGYQECWLDVTISGVGFVYLDVQALFWNSRQNLWWGGATRRFESTGRHALSVEARGGLVWLKVVGFSGTSFSLSADYALS